MSSCWNHARRVNFTDVFSDNNTPPHSPYFLYGVCATPCLELQTEMACSNERKLTLRSLIRKGSKTFSILKVYSPSSHRRPRLLGFSHASQPLQCALHLPSSPFHCSPFPLTHALSPHPLPGLHRPLPLLTLTLYAGPGAASTGGPAQPLHLSFPTHRHC